MNISLQDFKRCDIASNFKFNNGHRQFMGASQYKDVVLPVNGSPVLKIRRSLWPSYLSIPCKDFPYMGKSLYCGRALLLGLLPTWSKKNVLSLFVFLNFKLEIHSSFTFSQPQPFRRSSMAMFKRWVISKMFHQFDEWGPWSRGNRKSFHLGFVRHNLSSSFDTSKLQALP